MVFVCCAGTHEIGLDFFFNVYIGACSIKVKADVQPSPWLRFYSLHTHWTEINVQVPVLWFLSEFVLPLFSTVCTFIWYSLFIIYVSHDHLGKLRYCFHSYHLYITKTLPWPRHKCFFSMSLGFQVAGFHWFFQIRKTWLSTYIHGVLQAPYCSLHNILPLHLG